MTKEVERELKNNPLRFYDTVLFLSADGSDEHKQDFAMVGDGGLIQKHVAAMCMRHPEFESMLIGALLLADEARKHVQDS